jgi:peptidoglycan/LPS O-acetylase OafA/YrhL
MHPEITEPLSDLVMSSRPVAVRLLMSALLFQSIGAIGGGIALLTDPSGANIGMSVNLLSGSPFADFLIPGIVLLGVLGLYPLAVLWGVWRRERWARAGSAVLGLALVIWIGVQISVIGYSSRPPLQLVYGLLGVAFLVLSSRPSVRHDQRAPHAQTT